MKFPFRTSTVASCFLFLFALQSTSRSQSIDPYAEAREKDSALQNYRVLQQGRGTAPDADAALTADVVIQLLRSQPALKLQVKRVLIQKALDQGRLLAEEDLGDTELFGLIRDDLTIRKIASDEIEKRHYLPLRPTDEEAFEARLNQRRLQQLVGSEAPSLSKQENESVGGSARPGSQGGGGAVNPPSPRFTDSGPAISPPDDRTP